MKISIITPSFNQTNYLNQTIDSVLSQNYPNVEYIIIDGGSTDGSVEIIKKYEKQLTYWNSEQDNGQSNAINKGVQRTKGNIINWLNSDDYYNPNTFQTISYEFSNPDVKVVCGKSRIFNSSGTINYSRGTDVYKGNLYKTIGWARIDQPESFFRKEAWDKVGLLNEQLHYTMDREWWMRYLYNFGLKGIVHVDDVLVNFRLHNNSKTVSASTNFDDEHNTLFYLLASTCTNQLIKKLIQDQNTINSRIQSDIEKWTDQELIQKSLNYHLLKRADEFYYTDNLEAAKSYLSHIKPEWLAVEDQKLFKSLKLKSRLPLSVIHFFRT